MMADPMANLTGDPAPGSGSGDGNGKDVLDQTAMNTIMHNMSRVERIRTIMGITSGCVAGILGLTSLEGLACFLMLHLFVCVSICVVKMKGDLKLYTKQSWFGYLTTGVQPTALSFTLFWTLFYGLVYLY